MLHQHGSSETLSYVKNELSTTHDFSPELEPLIGTNFIHQWLDLPAKSGTGLKMPSVISCFGVLMFGWSIQPLVSTTA